MTFRARPVKRSNRPSWDARHHRNLYLNLGFGLVVIVSALILAAAAGATWYGDHMSPVAHVNGQSITKDDLTRQFRIDTLRLGIARNRLQTEHSAGRLSDSDLQYQTQILDRAEQQLGQRSLESLIDGRVEAQLADQQGIAVTADQIDAQLTKEATNPEQRHTWVIEVAPKTDAGKATPTEQQKADAKKAADQALADLAAGKDWVEVSKAVSTSSSAATGGDAGWITSDTNQLDAPLRDALFKLEANAHTAVILGAEGTYRIGRVTEIVAGSVDATYRQQITDHGVSLDDYKAVVRTDLLRTALSDRIQAQALQPGPQRHVLEIRIKAPVDESGHPLTPTANSVKARHILYAPNDDAQAAAKVKPDDPAWKKAEDQAKAAWQKVKADPSLFPQIASEESDDSKSAQERGSIGYKEPGSGDLVPAFADAIFKPGLKPGQILDPVKTEFGWHVIQIVSIGSDANEATDLKAQLDAGADFAKLAREFSDGPEASDGGDLGWIAKFQKPLAVENGIFNTPIGKVSDPVTVDGDGIYLFKVVAEETRTPSGDQAQTLKDSAFDNWYAAQKSTFKIERDLDLSSSG
jgi:parvulin-like peptidyl-prolyl isomerase